MRVTVLRAISTCLVIDCVMRLAKSTNKQDFMAFLFEVKQAVLPKFRFQMQILLYDEAHVYTCCDSQASMEDYFKPLQIHMMSYKFNCKCQFCPTRALNSNHLNPCD